MAFPTTDMTRRDAITILSGTALVPDVFGAGPPESNRTPWYATMRRCGQTNFNERDPIELDIPKWIDYWTSLELDALLLNAGGIMAFYPTKIPYQHRSKYLDHHDLFGDFAKTAKAKGIRVVARLDPNWVYEDAMKAHPEWIERRKNGSPVTNRESPWLYRTCMYSTYFTEQIPAIIREVNSLYDVDGFFTNGWPSAGRPRACYCKACRALNLASPDSPEGFRQHLAHVLKIWQLWDNTAKEKKWDSVYVGNLGGGIRAVTDLMKIAGVAAWFNADHQGRSGTTPIWDCAQQGRVAQSVMKGRTITNVTGAYSTTQPLWRHTSKVPLEMTMWLAQTTASGMVPWLHWLGGKPKDLRWQATGRSFYRWIARNQEHFVNRGSIANLAVLFSERTNAFYKVPGRGEVTDYLQGMYQALLKGRFVFDFVHEDDLSPETLAKYKALILPNTALLSDKQCSQLHAFASRGGSLMATFESGFYDENGKERARPGLAEIFGIRPKGAMVGPNGNSAYAAIEREHAILRGFSDTKLLPFAEHYRPLDAVSDPVLTVLPPFPAFPPEMVYPRITHTDQPAVVLLNENASRRVFWPGDISHSYWRSQNTDLERLLINSIRWLAPDIPISVTGAGVVEVFGWKTEKGFAVHVLNYTNPAMMRGWFSKVYP
ncbi:MAG: alpha-amylase family protein, partial [Candidatus Acidiferrales bacterium]